jgi:hypothetical protein
MDINDCAEEFADALVSALAQLAQGESRKARTRPRTAEGTSRIDEAIVVAVKTDSSSWASED